MTQIFAEKNAKNNFANQKNILGIIFACFKIVTDNGRT